MSIYYQVGGMVDDYQRYKGSCPTELHVGKLTYNTLVQEVSHLIEVTTTQCNTYQESRLMGMVLRVDYDREVYLEVV